MQPEPTKKNRLRLRLRNIDLNVFLNKRKNDTYAASTFLTKAPLKNILFYGNNFHVLNLVCLSLYCTYLGSLEEECVPDVEVGVDGEGVHEHAEKPVQREHGGVHPVGLCSERDPFLKIVLPNSL